MKLSTCYLDGDTYTHKEAIKEIRSESGQRIFQWNPQEKEWQTRVRDGDIDKLAALVQDACPELEFHVKVDEVKPPPEDVPF